jgi:hypothetical protein
VKVHVLAREQQVPASLEDVFDFFSRAENLDFLTPPWVFFRIVTPLPIEMHVDRRLQYKIRLAGVPVRWTTRISAWDPPDSFVDQQESGPYALWEHAHAFEATGDGTLMRDHVRYALPLGPLGAVAHGLAVRRVLAGIFDYRAARIEERFGSSSAQDQGRR